MNTSHTILLHRKRTGLSQGELAQLMGVSQSALSRIEEAQVADLRLDMALALTVVFGEPSHRMFNEKFRAVEEEVMTRAAILYEAVERATDRKAAKKRTLFEDMMRRATANQSEA